MFIKEYSKRPYNEKWSKKTATQKIKDYFKGHEIFLLEIDKKIIGFIVITTYLWDKGTRGYIDEIVIDSKFQGKGYGKKLMEFVEDYFRKKGIKEVTLMSSTKSKAFNIYKKLKYKEEKDFVSMRKKL
jgi:ribosomal protein S18 acetylase RimI-like enzyme